MPLLPSNEAKPSITQETLPDQSNKVFIVTGANAGVGAQLAEILYAHHAHVYIAARSEEKSTQAIEAMRQRNPSSRGNLTFLAVDLNDLASVRAAAQDFLSQQSHLHALWNNAGVMVPPQGSKTKQGYEQQLGVNCLGPFLLTKLLTPLLKKTAAADPSTDVRVVWVSSSASDRFAPQGGVVVKNLGYEKDESAWYKYGTSKAGNILYGTEMARRHGASGIVSVSVDPGNLNTDLYQHMGKVMRFMAKLMALHEPIYGAYTELYAGFSKEVTKDNNGAFIRPWGKISTPRKDIDEAIKSKAEGGTGGAEEFWEWSEKQVAPYVA